MSKRPHLLIFNPDQWRGDVMGHMGDPGAKTPRLDQFAAEDAVSFRHAYCQNPVCTPSRCSFMSGWYPHVRGHRTMFHMMRPDEPVLLRNLKNAGYYVWWGGKNDLVPGQGSFHDYCQVKYSATADDYKRWDHKSAPDMHGSTDWRGAPDGDNWYSFYVGKLEPPDDDLWFNGDWANVYGAIDVINHYDPESDAPLCLYLPLGFPHPPYGVEDPWYSMIDPDEVPTRTPTPTEEQWQGKPSLLRGIYARQRMEGWTEERWRELRRTYYGMCARVDHQFGMVIDALKAKGLYDDTAAFFFSDHGDYTGDFGLVEKAQNAFDDSITRVPFMVKPPKNFACKPGVSEAMVELVDFSATVEAITGVDSTHDHFGKSLLPVIAGETMTHRDAVFCEGGRREGETQAMELQSRQTQSGLYWPRVNLQQRLPEHTWAVMCRTATHKYVKRLCEQDELYDLKADPQELENRIDDPALTPVLHEMKDRTLEFFAQTCDVVPRDTDSR